MKKPMRKLICVLIACAALAYGRQNGVINNGDHIDTCNDGDFIKYVAASKSFQCVAPSMKSGMVVFIDTGSCPSGWTEVAQAGNYLLLTVAANGDAGGTGGSNSYTPAGTVTAPTLSGSTASESSHTHSVTSNVAQNVFTNPTIAWPAGVPTNASGAFSEGAISWPAGVPTNTGGSFTEGAISWPANVPAFNGSSTTVPALGVGTLAAPAHTHTITQSAFTTTKFTTNSSGSAAHTGGGVVTTPSGGASSTTITGSTATGTLTPLGTVAWPVNPPTIAAGSFTQATISWPAGVPTIGVGSFTQPTISWPTGVPTASGGSVSLTNNAVTSGTGSAHSHGVGTLVASAPAFSGSVATLQPTYYRLIACKKN